MLDRNAPASPSRKAEHNAVWQRWPVFPGVELCMRTVGGEIYVYYFLELEDKAVLEAKPRELTKYRLGGLSLPFGKA